MFFHTKMADSGPESQDKVFEMDVPIRVCTSHSKKVCGFEYPYLLDTQTLNEDVKVRTSKLLQMQRGTLTALTSSRELLWLGARRVLCLWSLY